MNTESEAVPESVNFDKLAGDFRLVVRDAEGLLKATAGELGEKLEEKTREARDRLSASLDNAKSTCRDLEKKARAGAQATDEVIKDHPYESIGIALGVGMLIGLLLGRR